MAAFFCNVFFNFVIGLLIAKFLGPEEYGRFALALATAMVVQTAFLDWVRLGATRFYSERSRKDDPALRATLDFGFVVVAVGLAVGGGLMLLSGVEFALSQGLIALALVTAVVNGVYDYNTALVRARFQDGIYTRLIIVKNIFAFALTGGGAFVFGSAKMALVGSILSISGAVVTARAALADPDAKPRIARRAIAGGVLRYAMPIIAAHLLYMLMPLANRSIAAVLYGFAQTGQFSLAYDMGTKAVQAIGSALDVLLFQIAVAKHESLGGDHAKQQIADNMAIVFAVILPACTGIWLVLPSVEQLIVPVEFRGPFGELLTVMMVGLFCFALILYAVNPIFQIAKRTAPLVGAAVIACVADGLLVLALPQTGDTRNLAIAQSGGFAAALVALIVFASFSKSRWPRMRDLAMAALGTAAMAAALLPLRTHNPGLGTLLLQVAGGTLVYSFFVFSLDIARLRTIIIARLAPLAARFWPPESLFRKS